MTKQVRYTRLGELFVQRMSSIVSWQKLKIISLLGIHQLTFSTGYKNFKSF